MDHFAALGIRTVIDLRRPHEVERPGRSRRSTAVAYHHVHLAHPHVAVADASPTPPTGPRSWPSGTAR